MSTSRPFGGRAVRRLGISILGFAVAFAAAWGAWAQEVPFEQVNVEKYLTNPHCKGIGDLDGDGQLDLVAGGTHGGALVWYRYVNRTMWTRHTIATGNFTTSMALADVDGDGDLDIVIPMGTATDYDIGVTDHWFENPRPAGDPATATWKKHNIGTVKAHDIVAGDVNGDGRTDVVVQYGTVTLFVQNSPDSWTQVTILTGADEGTALADIDRDGDLDIVLGGRWMENPMPAQPVTSAWTIRSYDDSIKPNSTKWAVAVADMNRDGRPDILLAPGDHVYDGTLRVYLAPADPKGGTWTRVNALTGSGQLHGIQAADIDRDGDLDIVTAEMEQSQNGKRVMLLYNKNGAATSWSPPQVVGTTGSHWIQVGDIDRDGDVDLYGINHGNNSGDVTVHVWRNKLSEQEKRPLGSWKRHVIDSARPWRAVFVFPADLDRDGKPDVVTGGWWYRNPGSAGGTWTRSTIGSPLNNAAVAYDFDRDGDLDLLGTQGKGSDTNPNFAWARNNGSGSFTILTNITAGDGDFLQGVAAGRFTRTGPVEVGLSWHAGGKGVQMLTVPSNPSSGTWGWRKISTTSQDEQLSAGDVDRDGDLDLVLGTKWLRNDGSAWTLYTLNGTGGLPDRNRLADMNGDGRLDVVVGFEAISVAGKLAWYEAPANATGTWTEHVISSTVVGPMSLDVADLDGDGDMDVVVGEHNLDKPATARLLIFENLDAKGGSWKEWVVYTGDEHHDGAQVVDLDGDGDLDIVSIGWSHSNVVVYENLASGSTTPTVPAAPTNLAATAVSSSQINLSWTDNATNETGFKIERKTGSGGTWSQIATVGAGVAGYQDTGLAASTTYYYRVRATNSAGDSAWSNEAFATTGGGGGGTVPTSGLQLWLKADAGVSLNGSAVSQWADQSGNGRHAVQAAAASQPSLVAGALNGKPALQFDGVDDFLTFTLPVNGLTGMTVVLVSACTQDKTGGSSNAENAAIFWNETASWGTVYLSPFQTNVKFRFGTTQTGNLPSYTRPASIGSGFSVTISVKNGTTDALYVDGTQVVSQGGKLSAIQACRETGNLGRGYNDNTYFPGRIAEVLVYNRALSDAERQGLEQYLNGRYFSAPNQPPTVAITSPSGGASFTAPATVTIQATASDPDGTVAKVEFYQGGTKLGEDLTSPYSFTWSNVPAGSYTLTAKATDNGGAVTTSSPVNVVVNEPAPAVPAAPTNLVATAVSSSQINLSWTDNATNETGFKIERKTGSGGTWSQIATVGANVTSYQNTGLGASTTYYYRVRATNAAGDSGYSNEATATTGGTVTVPAAPSNLAAGAVSSSRIDLSWKDNATNETGFKIERKTGASGTWSQIAAVGVNVTSYQDNGLSASTTYYYRVRATNSAGDSAYSNEASATTWADPNGPGLRGDYYDNPDFTGEVLTRTDPQINFDWGTGAPAGGMGADTFSVRWTGRVQAEFSEVYTFTARTDDGVRLWVNGELLVDQWVDQSPKEYSGSLALQAGGWYTIQMDYYENGGGAVAQLFWESPSTPKQLIPPDRFSPRTGPSDGRDNDGDGIPNDEDPDDDGDGIPDLEDPDRDGDGWSNAVEEAAGTDPDDARSVPGGAGDDEDGHKRCGATGIEMLALLGMFWLSRRKG